MNRPLRREGVRLQELQDEYMLYDEESDKIHILNRTAGSVWELCDGAHTLEGMGKEMRRLHEVPPDVNLEEDLQQILRDFADLQLLVFSGR